MSRLVSYAESLTESTTTSGSGSKQTKVSVSPTLVNGTTYLIIASMAMQINNITTTNRADADLYDNTGTAVLATCSTASADTTDYPFRSICWTYTASASASRTFDLRYWRQGTTGTVAIKMARLLVLELDPADTSATDASFTTNSSSYQDANTITFSPATSGDYLFIAWANTALTTVGYVKLLTPGGTSVNECVNSTIIDPGAGNRTWAAIWKETLAASSQTAKIQVRSNGVSNTSIQESCIVAIRLDGFYAAQTTQDDANDGGTNDTYTTSETLSATNLATATRNTIVLAAYFYSDNATTVSSYAQVTENNVQMSEGLFESNSGTKGMGGILAFKSSVGTGNFDFDIDRKSETTGATTTINFAAIAVLEAIAVTTFNQSVTAVSTASASILKTVNKFQSASSTASASIRRTIGKIVSATSTATASIIKTVSTTMTATTTATATLAQSVLRPVVMAATATVDAMMQRTVEKFASATATADAVIQKTVSFTIAASSTVTGTILKAYAVTLAAVSTASASITKTVDKILNASTTATGSLARAVAYGVVMAATSTVTATLATIRLFTMAMTATSAVTASMTRTVSITLTATISAFAKPIQWVASMYAAIRGDKPNWNQCARCLKSVRPNKLRQQMEWRGERLVPTGLYVCAACEDQPQPQNITPRHIGGDPRPVPNARPRRD